LKETTFENLYGLAIGESACVQDLHVEGAVRRRLLDLGFSIGTRVTAVRRSPLGDPVAFEVRGAVIALRQEQAEAIEVRPC
jgi:ferrous iron transport protein A